VNVPDPASLAPADTGPAAEAGTQVEREDVGDGRVRRMDPRYVPCARAAGLVFAGIVLLGGLATGAVVLAVGGGSRAWAVVLALLAFGAWAAGMAWFYPPRKFAHCTWRLSAAGLEIRRGVWFRHWISVPRARVQHTDVERGPLARRYGLATLVVHTAGQHDSQVQLDGLEHGVALAVRDQLLSTGASATLAPASDGA
jgi:hypothetical protein